MAANCLIDTGALLAVLQADDSWHAICVETFRGLRLPLVTTTAVLTEFFHLIGRGRHQMETAWSVINPGSVSLATITDAELPEIHALMSQYSDRPMDFADATLVYIAQRESLTTIFTVDHADFETYRIGGRKKFRIVPARRQ